MCLKLLPVLKGMEEDAGSGIGSGTKNDNPYKAQRGNNPNNNSTGAGQQQPYSGQSSLPPHPPGLNQIPQTREPTQSERMTSVIDEAMTGVGVPLTENLNDVHPGVIDPVRRCRRMSRPWTRPI